MNNKNLNSNFTAQYFTKELYREMEKMSDAEMCRELKDLTETRYWVAISKYVQSRLIIANGSLVQIDPIEKPAAICRAQGIMSGLMDLQDMTNKIKESIEAAEKKEQLKVEVTSGKTTLDEEDKLLY